MTDATKMNRWALKAGLVLMHLSYAPALFAADNGWFPKVASTEDMSKVEGGALAVTATIVKRGLMLLLFIIAVGAFIKFISVVSHGIEEAKKHEGGSIAVFANFAVMGIVYLALSIATGYLGYTVVSNFKL